MEERNGRISALGMIPLHTDDDYDFLKIDILCDMYKKAYSIFNELRSKCQLCDVALVVENRKLSAHKIVLAGTIPYFRGMFTLDLMEANMKEIHIEDMSYETLDQLLSFAYSGELRISTTNVQNLMMGANFFQMLDVIKHCGDFLTRSLHYSNALSILEFSKLMNAETTAIEVAQNFVAKHFIAVSQTEDFLKLSLDEVLSLLDDDNLHVDSEEYIFTSMMKWLNFDSKRHEKAAKLLPCVRLPLLTPKYLSTTVASNPIIKKDIPCRDLIDEAKDYHLLPERRHFLQSFKCNPRLCQLVPSLIVAIGGLVHQAQSKSSVEIYHPIKKTWSPIEGGVTLRTRVGVAVYQRQVYAIGGFNGQDRLTLVEKFDYDTKEWTTLSNLSHKRSALAAAFVGKNLYVCGGYDGLESISSIEIYDVNKDIWKAGPQMDNQRSAAGATVIDEFLYVCGGHDGMQIFSTVERLNTKSSTWERVPPMISKRCRFGAATYKGKIYVAGGYDGNSFLKSCECYDPKTEKWSPISPMNMRRSRVSLVAAVDGLFAVAGFDGENNLCSMEHYNVEKDEWTISTQLLCHEGGVGVGVIPIPPSELTNAF